jgi:transposase InsO family protein
VLDPAAVPAAGRTRTRRRASPWSRPAQDPRQTAGEGQDSEPGLVLEISRLAGPGQREWFYAYEVLDIFSRAIVGHAVETTESDVVTERLIDTTARRQDIDHDQLVAHSDRGPQLTSMTIAELLEDLGVTRSLSRPRVSNDNPFSEPWLTSPTGSRLCPHHTPRNLPRSPGRPGSTGPPTTPPGRCNRLSLRRYGPTSLDRFRGG